MRIISGSARGRHLKTPAGFTTRPTSDRVRESLFSILGEKVAGRCVLDLFAGTGSLGLEALSRGARSAVFIDRATFRILSDNVEITGFSECARVIRGDVFRVLRSLTGESRFSLVFIDPPYGRGLGERTLRAIDSLDVTTDDALLVAECGTSEMFDANLQNFSLIRDEAYGHTTRIRIYSRSKTESIKASKLA